MSGRPALLLASALVAGTPVAISLRLLPVAPVCAAAADSAASDPTRARGRWTTFTTGDGLPTNEIRCIAPDPGGGVWFGTRGSGVTHWDGQRWRTWTEADGIAGNSAIAFLTDTHGALWALGAGLSRFDGSRWQSFLAEDGLPFPLLFGATRLDDGTVLFSGNGGVCRGPDQDFEILWHAGNGLPHRVVHATLQDSRGDLWFATRGGLARFDSENWSTYLEGTNIRSLLEDTQGNLWFGTSTRGAIRFDGSNWTTFTKKRTLLPQCVDDAGRVWFASEHGGAWSFDGSTWQQYLHPEGPASSVVFSISRDPQGNLWFATSAGATRFTPER